MKNLNLIFLFLLTCIISLTAQHEYENSNKCSALTKQLLQTQDATKATDKYVFSIIGQKKYINAFIKTDLDLDEKDLSDIGVLIGTKAGNIYTIKVPAENLELLLSIKKGIEHIQLDQPIYSNLEKALIKTHVDSVHQGINLPQAFTGKDVIVGILDVGFDYTHPTFLDTEGNKYRIKRVWEQKTVGNPPAGYSYGHEMTDSLLIQSQLTDNSNHSHGTHVAGIAAGSGFGSANTEYRGVAYKSELVLVGITPPQEQWTNTGMTDIVDGLNYIFNYAADQGKAAVANLSWGCSIGPHDGTSLFSQAVDILTGPGKIFTISAGNNGENKIHIHKTFSANDTLVGTLVKFSESLSEKKTWLDIWGDSEEFTVQLRLYGGAAQTAGTDFMALDGTTMDSFLIGDDNDTFFFKMTGVTADINGKPHAFLDLYSKTVNDVAVSVKASGGSVNMWLGYVQEQTGHYGEFRTKGHPWAIPGDSDMTIGEMGCTASAITVAAYASKTNFTNLAGNTLSYSNYVGINKICPFSSRGPTVNGIYNKPDVTAPGLTLASAVNSADMKYTPGYVLTVHKYTHPDNGTDYFYAESSGTSMSAPMTAGIVALMLEANPIATPESLKMLMAETAIKDSYTTTNPDPNTWGVGKINAYGMFRDFIIVGVQDDSFQPINIYPNPTRDILYIDGALDHRIFVTDLMGKPCVTSQVNPASISLHHLSPGMYIIRIISKDNSLLAIKKFLKL